MNISLYIPPKTHTDFSDLHMAIWAMNTSELVVHDPQSLSEKSADEIYDEIVQEMHNLYEGEISTAEANEAARNLIGFCESVLAIQKRLEQDKKHAKLQ